MDLFHRESLNTIAQLLDFLKHSLLGRPSEFLSLRPLLDSLHIIIELSADLVLDLSELSHLD